MTTPTINPTLPVASSNLASADVRNNFAATYNDIQNIYNLISALSYGSIAIQNANNVNISGGIIDGTAIGNSVPAAGHFTNLTVSGTLSVPAGSVTNSMLATVNSGTIKGRSTAGTGAPEDLTATQATALLNNFVGDAGTGGTKGLVPAPAAGDGALPMFLSANGTWHIPLGGGDVVGAASSTDSAVALFSGTTGKILKNSSITVSGTTVTGNLSGTATNATNVATTQTSTNATFYPLFVASSTNGNQAADLGTGLTFNPSSNTLSTTNFAGALTNCTGLPMAAIPVTATYGSPTDITELNKTINHMWSAGVTDGAQITNNGDGTVSVSTAVVVLRQSVNVSSITRVGSVATVTTATPHGFFSGDFCVVNGANQTDYNGQISITVTGASSFTYSVLNAPATPATGTITVTDTHSQLVTCQVPASGILTPTDHLTNYIYASYNNGTPIFKITTNEDDAVGLSNVIAWVVAREGTTLYMLDSREDNVDFPRKSIEQLTDVMSISHAHGGTVLSETGTRNIAVSAGEFFHHVNSIPNPAFDTSGASTFTTAYYNGSVWVYTAGQQQIGNTQYNNIASGLASLTVGNYGVFWVYIMNNDPSALMVLYGQGDYSKSAAFGAQEPTLKPNIVSGVGVLIGRIIIKQGASAFTNIYSAFTNLFPNTSPDLDSLSDVSGAESAVLGNVLGFNGSVWTPVPAATVSAGAGVAFYQATPTIIATGTNNDNVLNTLSRTPITTAEQTTVVTANTNTVFHAAWLYNTALGRTSIDGGVWNFTMYAGVSSTVGGRVSSATCNIMQVIPAAGGVTITTTGTGTSRTAIASGGTIFVAGDASATNTNASYLQTPQGLYQITAFTSATVVTITTPTTYVNEAAVTFNKWFKLFGATSGTITSITPSYSANTFTSTQGAFTIATTDKLGQICFATSNNTTTITTAYNGTTHNSNVVTPLAVLHNDLAGLQGGTANEEYHLTSAEYTGTGTGNFVRATSPTLVTPALGTPTALVGTNITGTASGLSIGGNAATATNVAVGGITGLGTNVATWFATPSSANLAAALTDETGSGAAVFGTSPTLGTPIINSPNTTLATNAQTTNYTVLTTDSGKILTNTGAAGSVTFTLPAWAAGLNFIFIADAAQIVVVKANTGNTIRNGGSVTTSAGTFTSDATQGPVLMIVAGTTNEWYVVSIIGSWTTA